MSTTTSLIYIHGFNSSSASFKAQMLREHFARRGAEERFHVPDLPMEPRMAMGLLESTLAAAGPAAVVGSSLGGFYATWLAEHHDLRAVLINPVVRPHRLLAEYTGELHNYHSGEPAQFHAEWAEQLRHYAVDPLTCTQNILALVQTGDETLDWRDAADYYADCSFYRGLGGSHGFDDFDAFIPLLLRFCGIVLNDGLHDE